MNAKKNPWFRMYTDFLNDPKMIALAFEDQRHFIGILALKSDGAIDDSADENLLNRIVAQRLWIDHGVIRDVKKRLYEAGLIDTNWQPIAWDKRQFVSDRDSTATERKRRERAAKAAENNVTDMSRVTGCDSHKNVTRLDTDTDTEEEAKASMSPDKSDDAAADQKDKPESLPPCPHADLINLFAEKLPSLPQPKHELWSGARAAALKTRWRWVLTAKKRDGTRYATTRAEALDWFARFFGYVAQSDFLTGRDGKWTACDLGWLCNETNFAKVVQGNYDNKVAA